MTATLHTAPVVIAAALGFVAGVSGGALGIGGGILFVPTLVGVLGMSQLHAEATSLLAIIPVALVGALRQRHYGNLRVRDGLTLALLSPLGVLAGTLLANVVPERPLKLCFAVLLLFFAYRLARRALRRAPPAPG